MSISNVEWLLLEATDRQSLFVGERTEIDDEKWRANIERLQLGPGLRVFLTYAEAREDMTVEARDDRTDHWMASQVTIDGSAEIDFLDGQRTTATTDHAMLFRSVGRRAAYTFKAGGKFRSSGFGLDLGRVARLFDGDVPPVLQALMDPDLEQSRIVTMRGDRTIRMLGQSMFDQGLNGPLRRLMMEGAVIQLLAVQAAAAQQQQRARDKRELSPRERDAVHEARRQLLADMRNPPSLGELALAAGLGEKRLNTGFRQLFGATVFEVLRNERLAHARSVLQAGRASLKDVAFRVGYNHVSNFITAFTARYGAPPRQYLDRAG